MHGVTANYSGIVVNQNITPATTNDKIAFTSQAKFYQEFVFPSNYVRGTDADEQTVPPLTGFHLLVEVANGTKDQIGFDWTIDRYIVGSGWATIEGATGTVFGAVADGTKVWVEATAEEPIEISQSIVSDKFRISLSSYTPSLTPVVDQVVDYNASDQTITWGEYRLENFVVTPKHRQKANLRGQLGYVYQDSEGDSVYFTETVCPTSIWYSAPNPLANDFVTARGSDGTTALLTGGGATLSFLFRILALTADSGTDFLGNEYRSSVKTYSASNTNTVYSEVENNIWMSKPNPSRFAVESLYYDVRKKQPQKFGAINLIKNPNGESGGDFWFHQTAGTPATTSTAWAAQGSQSIRMSGTTASGTTYPGFEYQGNTATDWMRVRGGQKYSFSAKYNIVTLPASATNHYVIIRYADVTGSYLSGQDTEIIPTTTTTTGIKSVSLAGFTAPSAAYYATVIISTQTSTAGQAFDYMLDQVLFVQSPTLPAYFDGNSVGYEWEGSPNLSASVPIIEPTVDDSPVVVDKILVDPVTPGVFFHVYYSNEGQAGETEAEWENKLWIKADGTFQANKRETHYLAAPISAKFIKIEFSNLQAKSYNPGDQPRPVSYKKHPKWVLEYFLERVGQKNSLESGLLNKRVGVVFDAYDIAYNYYLDDIKQEPDQPVEVVDSTNFINTFVRGDTFRDRIDPETAQRIKISLTPYSNHISGFFGQSLIASVASATIADTNNTLGNYPSEQQQGSSFAIDNLRNAEVAFENDFPVMFFFVTCRHKYKESVASFSHNRAYFVGIRQISFARDRYTEQFDADHYIEPAGDLLNIERNDFVTVDGIMTTN